MRRAELLRAVAGLTLLPLDVLPRLGDVDADEPADGRLRPPEHALIVFTYHSGAERHETIGLHVEPCAACTLRSVQVEYPPMEVDYYMLRGRAHPLPYDEREIEFQLHHLNGRRETLRMRDLRSGTLYV
jgi:hypothetical protein